MLNWDGEDGNHLHNLLKARNVTPLFHLAILCIKASYHRHRDIVQIDVCMKGRANMAEQMPTNAEALILGLLLAC